MRAYRDRRVAIIGAGIGGLTAAIALAQRGIEAEIYEQARELKEVGAGIGLGPNAMKVLRLLGLEAAVKERGLTPESIVGRDWATAEILFTVPLRTSAGSQYGAASVTLHRSDLHAVLASRVPPERIHLNRQCIAVRSTAQDAVLMFRDGRRETTDLVIGCDGLHSSVRASIDGPDAPRFTGNTAWRALVPAENLPARFRSGDLSLWRGRGGHLLTYHLPKRDIVNLVAIRATAEWTAESWSVPASRNELLSAFPEVHPDLRILFERVQQCFKWGLFDRDPLTRWGFGRATLLGDAAHPMLPFLGQGAAMAIEDAYVLARELEASEGDIPAALLSYDAARIPRTARVQIASREEGAVLHDNAASARPFQPQRLPGFNRDWLYGYDPEQARTGSSAG